MDPTPRNGALIVLGIGSKLLQIFKALLAILTYDSEALLCVTTQRIASIALCLSYLLSVSLGIVLVTCDKSSLKGETCAGSPFNLQHPAHNSCLVYVY